MFFNVYACFFYYAEHEVQENIRDLNVVSIMTFMVNERILRSGDLHYFYIYSQVQNNDHLTIIFLDTTTEQSYIMIK
jgi:hypothetical protein